MPLWKYSKPFRITITELERSSLMQQAEYARVPYGLFFTSSGQAWYEQVNPNAQYHYIWRTDESAAFPLDIRATKEGKRHARKERKVK